MTIFKKSYGKWRYEQHENMGEPVIAHVQELQFYHGAFMPTSRYFCLKLKNEGTYIGTHVLSENRIQSEINYTLKPVK